MNIPAISAAATAGSAIFAVVTYFRNSATKRAEFLLGLHRTFFIETTYLEMREAMDATPEPLTKWHTALEKETAELTNFLNFFELVLYFQSIHTLNEDDVDALVGYYLKLMAKDKRLCMYLCGPGKSYEYLRGRLDLNA